MANTIPPVEDFWRGQTETEMFKLFDQLEEKGAGGNLVASAGKDLRELMGESVEEKRIEIAKRILKEGKEDLGIAHIVLARACSDLKEKEEFYRKAQKSSESQNFKANSTSGSLSCADSLNTAISLEFAYVLFSNSKRDAACDMLQKIQENAEALSMGQDIRDCLFSALGAYLICTKKSAEVRALLEIDRMPMSHWYYLNALWKFMALGDCIQSRSALSIALNDSVMIAVNLTSDEEDIDEEDLLTDWEYYYSLITLPAWQETTGAMEWLSKVFDTKHSLFGAEDVQDEVRYKKWQREMEVAEAHIRREDIKSIKRSFKMALREADSLNDGGDMFLLTAKMLGAVLLENGNSLDDLKESFDKKIAWLDKQESNDSESLFTSYSHFAKTLYELGMIKQAKHCARKAIDFYDDATKIGTTKLDYFYLCECLVIYGSLLSVEESFEEAERIFARLVSAQEEFLGSKHLNLVDGLAGQRFCLHQLQRHKEEMEIEVKLREIDQYFDADDEYKLVCDAAAVSAR